MATADRSVVQVHDSRCSATLRPGEVRRVPHDPAYSALALWLCCPVCGAPNAISLLHETDGTTYTFEEHEGNLRTLEPSVPCCRCHARIAVKDGAWVVTLAP